MTEFDTLDSWRVENPREAGEVEKAIFSRNGESLFVQNWEEGFEVAWYTDAEPLDVLRATDLAYPVNKNATCTIYDGLAGYTPDSDEIKDYSFESCEELGIFYDFFDVHWSDRDSDIGRDGAELYETRVYCMENCFEPVQAVYPETSYSCMPGEDSKVLLGDVRDYLSNDYSPDIERRKTA